MKDITEAAVDYVMLSHPNAVVEDRDGVRVLCIPMYDVNNDRCYVEERRIVKGPDETPMGILPVFNVRKGPRFNPAGEPHVSPLGKLYDIIGWSPPSPPPKDKSK